jgi:hypothetical protein
LFKPFIAVAFLAMLAVSILFEVAGLEPKTVCCDKSKLTVTEDCPEVCSPLELLFFGEKRFAKALTILPFKEFLFASSF